MAEKINPFKQKKISFEILEDVYSYLLRVRNESCRKYVVVGQVQKINWRTDEPVFDEDGNPVMIDSYDYVDYSKEDIENDPDIAAKVAAFDDIIKKIEKLM